MSSPIDDKAFEKLRRIAPNQLAARRDPTEWRARELPEEIAFKLTNRCDLRCTHCYQWNDVGYHHKLLPTLKGGDLPLAVVAKVLDATRDLRSNVFVWGGEPLVYREWDGLVELLAEHERWTSICTNGTLLVRRLESLERISDHLEMSVSIDGFEPDHDALRGEGVFDKTIAGIEALVASKQAGRYRGEISVNCVLSDALVPRLHDFVGFVQELGVETVYLSFPWHISEETAAAMDDYVRARLPHVNASPDASWRSFTFKLSPQHIELLRRELARVDATCWRIKVRYNPSLSSDELVEFLGGGARPAQNKTRCLALRTRMDVFPNGDIVSCKFFPELVVGNVAHESVTTVWHGEPFDRMRQTIATCGLMPICAKCNLLYTRGA